jgi:Zn-finger nucleic acid-binding protein
MVFDAISRRIEDVGKITRVIKVNNAEVELFNRTLYFRDRLFSNEKGLCAKRIRYTFICLQAQQWP